MEYFAKITVRKLNKDTISFRFVFELVFSSGNCDKSKDNLKQIEHLK